MQSEEGLELITLREDFYRDKFSFVAVILTLIGMVILFLLGIGVYLFFHKPDPVFFAVGDERRVMPAVPVTQSYLTIADLLQWVTMAVPNSFNYDFVNYNDELTKASQYFTTNGWKNFLNQINIYADYNTIQSSKLFVHGSPGGAPFVLNQGLLQGRYAWWVQMPINLNYTSFDKGYSQTLTLQILVIRVPTLNNLAGVGIDNVLVTGKKNSSTVMQ